MDTSVLLSDRKRTFLLSAVTNYGTIVVSIVVGLISVPIGLHYFGPVLYGIWFVIGSILGYLRMADFGIKLSTLTLIAQNPNASHQRVILRRSLGLLLEIAVFFIGVVLIVSRLFPGWIAILGKIPSNFQREATTAVLALGILIFFQLPTTAFTATFSGLQKVHWNRIYSAFNSISLLAALLITILIRGNLVTLAIFTGIGSLLIGIISGIHLFIANPDIQPRFTEKITDAPSNKLIFISGIRFLILSIASLIILNTDNLVISHCIGAANVTPYAVTFKIFYTSLMIVNGSIFALWPMYGKAFGNNDWQWIQWTYNRITLPLLIAGGLVWIGGIIFCELFINLWVGSAGYGGLLTVFALGGYVYLSSFGGSNVSIVNGLNPTSIVVVFGLIEAGLNIVISLLLVKPLGIGGVALGTFIASLAVNTWFHPVYIRYRTLKKVSLKIKPILIHTSIVAWCVILALIIVTRTSPGWTRFASGVAVIILYLLLSWKNMPGSSQNFIRDSLTKLLQPKNAQKITNL